jgi:metal-responsive CopG/Arc/MetJ family transcriptional regulator
MSRISVELDDRIIQDLENMIPILMDEIGVPVTFSDVVRWACRDYVKNKGGKK